ncbi:DUF4876 domain-containing protein [Labilibaculum sp. DW002]|uniref:DUF4876 domain-containing protein n=1 Tax=Paralabilibaculum antarcticum TaxID=2912572 RepID=A0ABT5VNC1_9BACT|nr:MULTISPECIES: DUF4876 domain-containing protein [unclassified Labilibaculum]MBI9059894.1 DUF4876 domain-containing protein [Labilibaculum sp.]MDE5416945.1 DUF4876 domain-containing protein [Labilibaculum sp. DW002]
MKNKRSLLIGMCTLFALGSTLISCNDDTEVKLANLDVTVGTSETFSGITTDNLYVYLQNTTDQAKDSAMTNASGVASFLDIAPGTYNLSCVKNLTASEASDASGYYEAITLNGTKANVSLFGGVDSVDELVLDGKPSSSLVIKEFYYSGANDPSWGVMFKDQFVEIYNNSAEVVYADGLYLASIVPQRNGSNDNDVISTLSFEEFIYADKIAQVPGSGQDNPILPGESIVIAFDAIDWTDGGTKDFTVDLSGADFELYAIDWLESLGRTGSTWFDLDNADVPNMNMVYMNIENNGFFSFLSTGASVAILRCDETPSEIITDPESSDSNPIYFTKLKVEDVIDGIDMLANADAGAYKKLPSSIDAGFNYVEGTSYTSLSVSRKVSKTTADGRIIYQDTNNSSEDFESGNVAE